MPYSTPDPFVFSDHRFISDSAEHYADAIAGDSPDAPNLRALLAAAYSVGALAALQRIRCVLLCAVDSDVITPTAATRIFEAMNAIEAQPITPSQQ